MKNQGYKDYIEKSYSSDSYSKPMVRIIEHLQVNDGKYHNRTSSLYTKYINKQILAMKNKQNMFVEILNKKIDKCGKEKVKNELYKAVSKALDGKNYEVNNKLSEIDMLANTNPNYRS